MSASVQYRGSAAASSSYGNGVGVGASSSATGVHHRRAANASSSSYSGASASGASADGTPPPRGPPARRAARRKNSKGTAPVVGIVRFHPEEVFHLALLGLSLLIVGSVVVYRAVSLDDGVGGGAAYDDAAAADRVVDDPTAAGAAAGLRSNGGGVGGGGGVGSERSTGGGGGGGGGLGFLGGLASAFARVRSRPKPCPESMDHIGDKSRRYYELRQEYEALLPPEDSERTLEFVRGLRKREYGQMADGGEVGYDVRNCPLYPPPGYPAAWPVLDVLENWPSDDPEPRPSVYQGVCVFDHETELEKARNYRAAEVPFVMRDDPAFLRTAERWNQPGYMERLLGPVPHRTEYSPNNHFMYWMSPKLGKRRKNNPNKKRIPIQEPEGWTPPTKLIRMPYDEWLQHANTTDDKLGPDHPHWYYRLIGCGEMGKCDKDSSEYLFDEIPNFQPRDDNFYIPEPDRQKGIHCRFGMKGVIAENHFDGSRNTIALFGGERRYVLSHPDQCPSLALLPKGHPSARHSAVDWSDPDLERFPQFRDAKVNEVVMQAGDALYLPTNWFHYIVSLELNFQCNSRSGINTDYAEPIRDCGF